MKHQEHRAALAQAHRIVVKFGTRVLVDRRGRPSPARLRAIVDQLARLHAEGREIVVVSSGAVGAGLDRLGFTSRPTALADLQMAASVGQNRLMSLYSRLFEAHGITVGQILLNHDDLKNRVRHLNARNTFLNLLKCRVIPIVNENDVTSVDEIRVGDNDALAALVTLLVDADALILGTSVDGLRAPASAGRTRRVPYLQRLTQVELDLVFGKGSELSTGGMATKLEAARTVNRAGALSVIVDARRKDTLLRACRGENTGTLLAPVEPARQTLGKRKHWIAFFHRTDGTLVVDDGARRALVNGGKSLLPAGILEVQGNFSTGSVLKIVDREGKTVGSGLTEFGHDDLRRIQGRSSREISALLGPAVSTEVIHRDNLVLLAPEEEEAQ